MAVNIYVVCFRNYITNQLKSLDHKYFIACYGLSLIPAITYLFINTKERGRIYGGAVVSLAPSSTPLASLTIAQLWCWVSRDWDFLRIAILYVFMWSVPPLPLSPTFNTNFLQGRRLNRHPNLYLRRPARLPQTLRPLRLPKPFQRRPFHIRPHHHIHNSNHHLPQTLPSLFHRSRS